MFTFRHWVLLPAGLLFATAAAATPPLVANDDYATYVSNGGQATLHPGANDVHDPDNVVRDTLMTVLEAPQHGDLVQVDHGTGIDYFNYSADPDYSGRDRFRYRLCKSGGGECIEATVHLRGIIEAEMGISGARSGGGTIDILDLAELADARYSVSSLAHARELEFDTGVDATPHLAWDTRDGMAWTTATLPVSASGETVEYRIAAESVAYWHENLDLRIGVDRDGDGRPSADEQECLSVGIAGVRVACDVAIEVGSVPVVYWIAMHSREPAPWSSTVELFEMRMDDPGSLLKVTGPVTVERGGPVQLMASWIDPTALGPMRALVRIVDGDIVVGELPMPLHGGDGVLLLPTDATPVTLDLRPTSQRPWEDRGLFFDVPPGAESLTFSVRGDQPLAMALHRFGFGENWFSGVTELDAWGVAHAFVQVPAGESRTITVHAPQAGRWYALVKNTVDEHARAEVRVDVEAILPALRAGSYYNPLQPGHGLLLYPAADQWAGLWYTYDRHGRPTWYYLQAPRPGADGIWRAPILRTAWNGASTRHTQVGHMQITPHNDQRFSMSYILDGFGGSQVMEALGSGCPMKGDAPLDISSHWFDPARAGNGYSVQTWANGYQFMAAFTYDHQGYPLFLAAERPDLGGDVAELALEYLEGSCPTFCGYIRPKRMPAGVLRRTLAGGRLSEISLDVDYPEPWPFEGRRQFTVTDHVQLLGGQGSTQGCAP